MKLTGNEVTELVPADNESSHKTSDDHDLVNQDGPENRWPWHASSEEQVEK